MNTMAASAKTTSTRRCYTVPAWAKRELGADLARSIARLAMACAKENGATFEQACDYTEAMLLQTADGLVEELMNEHREMQRAFDEDYFANEATSEASDD